MASRPKSALKKSSDKPKAEEISALENEAREAAEEELRREEDEEGGGEGQEGGNAKTLQEAKNRWTELKKLGMKELINMGLDLGIADPRSLRKQALVFSILEKETGGTAAIYAEGVLEVMDEGYGFLRSPEHSYVAGPDDVGLGHLGPGAFDADALDFLGAFRDHDLTYGLTFVGGLVPGNFRFNPSVFTLAIVNGSSDVSDVASGGLRMPPSVAGFMAFSWLGAVLVPFVSGLLTGHFVHRLRRLPRENLAQHVAGLLWYQVCASFLINFYAMSYQGLIAMLLFFYLVPDIGALARLPASPPLRRRRWRLGRRRNVLATP